MASDIQKATTTPTTSSGEDRDPLQLDIDETKSKAIERLGGGISREPIPADVDRKNIYLLMMKIGATGELPSRKELKDAMLNDFWSDLYWKNPLVPSQIPFSIIIREFKTYAVQNSHDRKGNNQGEIIRQFNEWIQRPKVIGDLVNLRNELYPELKPKEIAETSDEKPVEKYSDAELKDELQKAKAAKEKFPIPFVDVWITRLSDEIEKRRNE